MNLPQLLFVLLSCLTFAATATAAVAEKGKSKELLLLGRELGEDEKHKNILFLLPMSSKSHRNVFEPIITAMAALNHNLVVVSAHPSSKPKTNVRELSPTNFGVQMAQFKDPITTRREGSSGFIQQLLNKVADGCEQLYQNEEFMDLLNIKFDLVFVNAFWNECTFAFVHKLGAPHIIVSSMAVPPHVAGVLGNRLPPSFVPGFTIPYTDSMSFWQRMHNLVASVFMETYFSISYVPNLQRIYRKYLGNDLPDLDQLLSNISAVFSNSHFVLTHPRPTLPNVIEVGAMHCDAETKSLPNDIEDFIGGAQDGFIYFSLGSIVQANTMPDDVRKIFVNVFARLKNYRILWKWETGHMADLPDNVKLLKWAPQADILAHADIKLFITHGGLLSTQEAAYHGVPLVGLPLFADQDLNMNQAEKAGNALALEILELTESKLEATIHRIIDDKRFSDKAKELSSLLRDQIQSPLQRAVFWSHYIMRHRGAPHIQSAARHLNFFQYHSIDVVATLFTIIFVTLWLTKVVIFAIFRKFCCRKNVKKIKSQ